MTGRDRSFISRVECGKCSATVDTVFLLASALGITPSQLFEGIAPPADDFGEPMPLRFIPKSRPMIRYTLTHF